MFHSFLSNNSTELPAKFTYPFCYKPNPLAVMAAEEVKEYLVSQTQWNDELKRGKMFGVLVVKNQNNQLGYLAGFSGRIADSYHHSFFVPPIYDLKESSGFFLREEECISNLNEKIKNLSHKH
jgi:tRNA pseudouridine32 synthase/23S rRNA pseudouridine746 synthase